MTNTITDILSTYGFENRKNHTQWWGVGSLVWGYIAEVHSLGNDLYEVKYHRWYYDECGECVEDVQFTSVLHGALLLKFVFEKLPIFSYYRPNRKM